MTPWRQKTLNSWFKMGHKTELSIGSLVWTYEPMNPWTDKPMNSWTHEPMNLWAYEHMNPWTHEPLSIWAYEPMDLWTCEPMNLWTYESLNPWTYECPGSAPTPQPLILANAKDKEKKTLPRAPPCVTEVSYVAIQYPHPGWGVLTPFPFEKRGKACVSGTSLSLRID